MIRRYIKELFQHWVNVTSAVAVVVAVLAGGAYYLAGGDVIPSTVLGLAIAMISFLPAGYYVWRDAVE